MKIAYAVFSSAYFTIRKNPISGLFHISLILPASSSIIEPSAKCLALQEKTTTASGFGMTSFNTLTRSVVSSIRSKPGGTENCTLLPVVRCRQRLKHGFRCQPLRALLVLYCHYLFSTVKGIEQNWLQ